MFINRCAQRVARANGLAQHLASTRSTNDSGEHNADSDHSAQIFSGLKDTCNEQESDKAGSRFGGGLSCPLYMVQMVKNKKDPTDQYHANIVHCGKAGTLRHKLFYSKTPCLWEWTVSLPAPPITVL